MLLGSERKLVMLSTIRFCHLGYVQYSTASPSSTMLVLFSHNPVFTVNAAPISFALQWELLLFFPIVTKMFQIAMFSLTCTWIQQQFERLTYSRIFESTLILNSPKHFVAY
ncbi:unnamed protein product [Linum trigynum]|uniref:Uncharacterized protein n=1 Tax=Linum trigynum TaxID=586398 RepID=A0AAV2D031_9ROSI